MPRLVLLSLGQSSWNQVIRFSGWSVVVLSDVGREVARSSGGLLRVSGDVFGDELELLAQPPADDRVVLVESEGDRFAGENFFANVIADQAFQFACARRPPSASCARGRKR